jgi:hypothetical protein
MQYTKREQLQKVTYQNHFFLFIIYRMSLFQFDSISTGSANISKMKSSAKYGALSETLTIIHQQQQQEENKTNAKIKKVKIFFKKFLSFFFSRIGLTFLFCVYVAIGGFIFKQIEGKQEREENFEINLRTQHLIKTVWDISRKEIFLHRSNFTHKLRYHVTLFQNGLVNAARKGFQDGDNRIDAEWSYPNSILYSMSIITTIG